MKSIRLVCTLFALVTIMVLANVSTALAARGTITEYPLPTPNSDPASITLGPDGNLWFIEQNTNQIGKITPSGTLTEYPAGLNTKNSSDIITGPDGNLWYLGGSSYTIGKMTPAGVATIYQLPVDDGQSGEGGIAVGPDGNIWYTMDGDYFNYVGRLTLSGTVTEYHVPTGLYAFSITAGFDGKMWFVAGDHQFGSISTKTGKITGYPIANPNIYPYDLIRGDKGNLWFSDPNTRSLGVLNTTTQAITEYSISDEGPGYIARGPHDTFWFTKRNGIGVMNPSGKITEYPLRYTYDVPLGITRGPQATNTMWFTEVTVSGSAVASITTS